jgi:hypothetical protein
LECEIVAKNEIPYRGQKCGFCADLGKTIEAEYDFKSIMRGAWANACEKHWIKMRAYPELGTGKGQKLVKGLYDKEHQEND